MPGRISKPFAWLQAGPLGCSVMWVKGSQLTPGPSMMTWSESDPMRAFMNLHSSPKCKYLPRPDGEGRKPMARITAIGAKDTVSILWRQSTGILRLIGELGGVVSR